MLDSLIRKLEAAVAEIEDFNREDPTTAVGGGLAIMLLLVPLTALVAFRSLVRSR